jgi:hypothetical protein
MSKAYKAPPPPDTDRRTADEFRRDVLDALDKYLKEGANSLDQQEFAG